jgi:hypothetical protein
MKRRSAVNTRKRKILGLLTIVVVLLAANGCVGRGRTLRVGKLQTESRSVELGGAESVRVQIDMGAGELAVSGGADGLLAADFAYNVAEFKPEVAFGSDVLAIRQPDVEGRASFWDLDDYRYEWDLRLNDDVPIEMTIDLGAGNAQLELGTLSLTGLDVNAGAGDVTVDLAGASSLTKLDIDIGAGEVTVDLTGDWHKDLEAHIKGGLGKATLRLPRGVGVRVDVEGGLGKVNASGLKKDGEAYVNDAYGESEVTLRIDVVAGLGAIDLELEE